MMKTDHDLEQLAGLQEWPEVEEGQEDEVLLLEATLKAMVEEQDQGIQEQ